MLQKIDGYGEHRGDRIPVQAAHAGPERRKQDSDQRGPRPLSRNAEQDDDDADLKMIVDSALEEVKKEPTAKDNGERPFLQAQPPDKKPARQAANAQPEQNLPQPVSPQRQAVNDEGDRLEEIAGP